MTAPIFTLHAAFGQTWADGLALTWTDITPWLRHVEGISIRRGRSTEFDQIRPGTASFTLANDGRRFDPEHTTGPHYGDLVPGVPVKVAIDGGPDIFTGYVVEWPQTYSRDDVLNTVAIEAVDLLAQAARTPTPASVLEATIRDLDPIHYWPLAETAGDVVEDVANGADGLLRRPISDRGASILPYDTAGSVSMRTSRESDPAGQAADMAVQAPATAMTVAMWLKADPRNGDEVAPAWIHRPDQRIAALADTPHRFALLAGARLTVDVGDGTTAATAYVDEECGSDVHLYVVTVDATASTITPYLDGRRRSWHRDLFDPPGDPFAGIDIAAMLAELRHAFIGFGITIATGGPGAPELAADIAHVALFDRALDDTEVAAIYAAGVAPWEGDKTGERIHRILDLIGWPTGDRDIDAAGVMLGPATLDGDVIDQLSQTANAENGRLYIDTAGRLSFRHRYTNVGVDAAVTLTDVGDGTYADARIVAPVAHLANRVDVSGTVVEEPTSIDRFGVHGKSLDASLLPSIRRRRDLASFVLSRTAVPRSRVDGLLVRIHDTDDELADAVLTLDIGHRVAFVRTPQGVGDPIVIEAEVEGLRLTADSDICQVELYLSPHDATPYWRAGISRAGTETIPGY